MDRMSQLPTIKCSSCSVDIDILHLADHVCAAPPPSASLPSPPSPPRALAPAPAPAPVPAPTAAPKLERATTLGGPSFSNRSDGQASSGRMPPPARIDPNAANNPFRPREPATNNNHNDFRNRSPPSNASRPKSPFKMGRSVTTPLPRPLAPQSPDLPPNMDCAFPPFPSKSATPQSAKSQPRDRLEPNYQQRYAPPSPLFAPLSPRINGGENIAKRMNAIAPGPFDGRVDRRPSTASVSKSPERSSSAYGHRRTDTQGSTRSNGSLHKRGASLASNTSRSSTYSNRSIGLPANPKAGLNGTQPPPPPSASEQTEGIDAFLSRLQKETMMPSKGNMNKESRAVPAQQDSGESRGPPLRPRRPSDRDLPSTDMMDHHSSSFDSSSRSIQPAPLVVPTFGNDAPPNSLHTPSDSGLSDDSYASSGYHSVASSRSSPPGSVVGHSRDASKLSRFDYIAEEAPQRTASPESYADSRSARGPGSYARPNGPQPIPRVLSPGYSNVPESPMDPAIQMGTFDRRPKEPQQPREPVANNEKSPPRRLADAAPTQPDARRPKGSSKGNCRGCSEPIIGKSVKDSSGRLTGRYHKQCFSCRTCGDPFPTAEFYVFENFPYCEQHYHKLNGSLCSSCDHGIEGQYLETDNRQKFHPRCFTCNTCRVVLRDDYYEVGGQKFCGRHAQHAAAPPQSYLGPGGYKPRNVQKRRTRLMMMA